MGQRLLGSTHQLKLRKSLKKKKTKNSNLKWKSKGLSKLTSWTQLASELFQTKIILPTPSYPMLQSQWCIKTRAWTTLYMLWLRSFIGRFPYALFHQAAPPPWVHVYIKWEIFPDFLSFAWGLNLHLWSFIKGRLLGKSHNHLLQGLSSQKYSSLHQLPSGLVITFLTSLWLSHK